MHVTRKDIQKARVGSVAQCDLKKRQSAGLSSIHYENSVDAAHPLAGMLAAKLMQGVLMKEDVRR
jgi:hypothetical protein